MPKDCFDSCLRLDTVCGVACNTALLKAQLPSTLSHRQITAFARGWDDFEDSILN